MKDDGIPFSYFLGGKKSSKKSSKKNLEIIVKKLKIVNKQRDVL